MTSKFDHLRRLLRLVDSPRPGRRPEGQINVPAPRSDDDPPGPHRTQRILIMSQDEDTRFLLMRRLQMSEYFDEAIEAPDAASALNATRRLRPDVVVVHLQSATVEECAVLTAVRAMSPRSKIVAYSNYLGLDAQDVATAAGADRFLVARGSVAAVVREVEDILTTR